MTQPQAARVYGLPRSAPEPLNALGQ